jgi:predicted component of type VI protein secretion system
MVFKKIAGLFNSGKNDEYIMVATRALTVHGLNEYNETSDELGRLKQVHENAPTKAQRKDVEKLLDRVQCRQDALRSAAVVLFNKLGGNVDLDVKKVFGITDKDIAKVSSGIANSRQNPANEVVQFLIEEAQSDFISGRA